MIQIRTKFEKILHYNANLSSTRFFDNCDVINTINEIILTLKIHEKRKII